MNGGELLFLALATCYCNDLYREALARGIKIEADGCTVTFESQPDIAQTAMRGELRSLLILRTHSPPARIPERFRDRERGIPTAPCGRTMVDSQNSKMAVPENIDARFERVESRLDELQRTVGGLQRAVDEGAVRVDQAFADQRLFTEFAFDRLRSEMHERFSQVDARFEQVNGRFEQVDGRFEQMGGQLGRLERKMDWLIEFVSNRRS